MATTRVQSVDALRGLVMIIMALDHTREFFSSAKFQPEDLTQTTAAYFFTRWITHFCAPVFMFTAGIGAYLWFRRGRTIGQLSRFLWTRGLWLIVLELTVLRIAMPFDLLHGPVLLTILWALGWSMISLAVLVRIPIRPLAVLSVAAIALHNLADPIRAKQFGGLAGLWNILHQPGIFNMAGKPVLVAYPLVPWMFVMAAGFCFGSILTLDAEQRRPRIARLGLLLTLAFVLIRAINIYGDPFPRSTTVLSFLRCTKYPPSLDFLLMTLGPALLLLAWFDGRPLSRDNPVMIFGRVPLFYFLLHFYLLHVLALLLNRSGAGYPLAAVYAVWIAVVVLVYPACRWFAHLKQRRTDWWLSYL